MYDPLSERKSVMTVPLDFEVIFRGGVKDEYELEDKFLDARYSAGSHKREQVGIRFVESPPNGAQALLHALPPAELPTALSELLEKFDKRLATEFGDLPRVLAIHTDKGRFHIEVIMLKYMPNGNISPGFKGLRRCHSGHVADAVLAAQFGGEYPWWFALARMAHDVTQSTMEMLKRFHKRHIQRSNNFSDNEGWISETQAYHQRLLVAHEYRCFLEVATTDKTLQGTKKRRSKLSPAHPMADRPFTESVAWDEIEAYLGDGKPGDVQITDAPDFILRARLRIRRIQSRRERESSLWTRPLSRLGRIKLFAQARRRKSLKDPELEAMRLVAQQEIKYAAKLSTLEDALLVNEFDEALTNISLLAGPKASKPSETLNSIGPKPKPNTEQSIEAAKPPTEPQNPQM